MYIAKDIVTNTHHQFASKIKLETWMKNYNPDYVFNFIEIFYNESPLSYTVDVNYIIDELPNPYHHSLPIGMSRE